ncbi:MAG: hypothetical protein K8R88_05405, partial [Armatimonadetes bacterium]|nr:hypothetical protein [Armatimonadota bacterium]
MTGCGGGGGSATSGELVYRTFWTSRSDPGSGTGQSEIINIKNIAGQIVATQVLNRSAGNQAIFTGLPSGVLTVECFLYSQPSGNGNYLGKVSPQITLASNVPASVDTEV